MVEHKIREHQRVVAERTWQLSAVGRLRGPTVSVSLFRYIVLLGFLATLRIIALWSVFIGQPSTYYALFRQNELLAIIVK